jgi:PAS domain S-box-containing protein
VSDFILKDSLARLVPAINRSLGEARERRARSAAEEALRQSEAHFRFLFENMLNGYAYCRMLYEQGRPVDFIYLDINRAFSELTGLKDVVGKKVSEVIPGIVEANPELFEIYGRVASTGVPMRFESFVDAMKMWFSISVYCPRPDHFVAVFDVITERKLAEQELIQSQAAIRGLLDATTDSILLLDNDYRIQAANQVAIQRLGLGSAKVKGRSIFDFLPAEVADSRRAHMDQVRESGQPLRFRDQRLGLHFDSHIYPVTDKKGQVTGIAIFARDVTQAMKDEDQRASLERQLRQAQKMEAIGTLAGGIAHDFNNILAVIVGYSEMALGDAKRGCTDPADLEEIAKAADRAKSLVRQILTFSRKVEVEKRPLDLNKEVLQASQLMGKTIPKMIHIRVDLDPDLQMVKANANQMEQVLLNLGTNAADAMPDGGKLHIQTENRLVDEELCLTCGKTFSGAHVALTISDTGQGIDPLALEHVFEPFFTTKELGRGTGLGLSTVHGIVTSHGGHITCASTPGAGTTFTLYFPVVQPKEDVLAAIDGQQPLLGGHETILLADDEEALLRLGSRILQQAGYVVLQAATGEQAVREYRRCDAKPHAVVLDLGMPGMGGKKALEEILTINPHAKVVIASGYGTDGRVKEALRSGAVGFVAKPYGKVELLRTVRKALDRA